MGEERKERRAMSREQLTGNKERRIKIKLSSLCSMLSELCFASSAPLRENFWR